MSLGFWEEVADQDEIEHYARLRREREDRIKNYVGTRAIVAVAPVQDRPRGKVSRKWEAVRNGDKITLSQITTITHPSGKGEMFPERETSRKATVGTFTLSPRQVMKPGMKPILKFALTQNRKGDAEITPTDDAQLAWDGEGQCPIAIGVNTSPLRGVANANALNTRNARVDGKPVNVLTEDRPKNIPDSIPCKNAALRVVLETDQSVTVGWLLVGRIEARPSSPFKSQWREGDGDIATAIGGDVMVGGKTPNCWHFVGKGKFSL